MYEIEKAILAQASLEAPTFKNKTLIKKINSAKNILCIGTGSSYHAALFTHYLISNYSKKISSALTSWDFLNSNINLDKTCLVVMFSHRGNKGLTEKVLLKLKKLKLKTVLVASKKSKSGHADLLEGSDLETAKAHTKSVFAAIRIGSEICHQISEKKFKPLLAAKSFSKLSSQLQTLNTEIFPIPSTQPKVKKNSTLYFTGTGIFYSIAQELALKTREILQLTSFAYSTEEILHGPLTALYSSDIVIHLDDAFPLNELITNRSNALALACKTIGVQFTTPELSLAQEYIDPKNPIHWALLQLYWGQRFLVQTAIHWKINPDLNRTDEPKYNLAAKHVEL